MALEIEINGYGDRDDAEQDFTTAYKSGSDLHFYKYTAQELDGNNQVKVIFNTETGAGTTDFAGFNSIYFNFGPRTSMATFTLNAATMGASLYQLMLNAFSSSKIKKFGVILDVSQVFPIPKASYSISILDDGSGTGTNPPVTKPLTHIVYTVKSFTTDPAVMASDPHSMLLEKSDDPAISTVGISNILWGQTVNSMEPGSTMTIRFAIPTDKFDGNETAVDQNFTFRFKLHDGVDGEILFTAQLFSGGFHELAREFKSRKQFSLELSYINNPAQYAFVSVSDHPSPIHIEGKEVRTITIDGKEVSQLIIDGKVTGFW